MTSSADAVLLPAAGAIAGAVGSARGITSLISYPALLAVGVPPLPANVTQAVAFVTCLPGSALGSRPELRGQGTWLRRWVLLTAAGVALLLCTPGHLFGRIVPFLLAFASISLLVQPRISMWQKGRLGLGNRFMLPCGLFAVSVYGGYFGAGSGVVALTLILLTVDRKMVRANALKNMLLGVADVVAAIGFVWFGSVRWTAALPLGLDLFAGSRIGASVTRRVSGNMFWVLVALAGLGLAIRLWIVPSQREGPVKHPAGGSSTASSGQLAHFSLRPGSRRRRTSHGVLYDFEGTERRM